jgi:hypothetical protein
MEVNHQDPYDRLHVRSNASKSAPEMNSANSGLHGNNAAAITSNTPGNLSQTNNIYLNPSQLPHPQGISCVGKKIFLV